jgi:hypothetical protein
MGPSSGKWNDIKTNHPTSQNKVDISPNHLPAGGKWQSVGISFELAAILGRFPDPLALSAGKTFVVEEQPTPMEYQGAYPQYPLWYDFQLSSASAIWTIHATD